MLRPYSALERKRFTPLTGRESFSICLFFVYFMPSLRRERSCLLQTHTPQSLIHLVQRPHAHHIPYDCKLISFTPSLQKALKQKWYLSSVQLFLPVAFLLNKRKAAQQPLLGSKPLTGLTTVLMQYKTFSKLTSGYAQSSIMFIRADTKISACEPRLC